METVVNSVHREPWNRGKIVGQKAPFKVKDAENLVTFVGTIVDYCNSFKMGSPRAYEAG